MMIAFGGGMSRQRCHPERVWCVVWAFGCEQEPRVHFGRGDPTAVVDDFGFNPARTCWTPSPSLPLLPHCPMLFPSIH